MNKKQINIPATALHMINHSNGYGFGQDTDGVAKLTKCLRAIPEDLLADFIYTMYRMADKTQTEGFAVVYVTE